MINQNPDLFDEAIVKILWNRPVDPRFLKWLEQNGKQHLITHSDRLARQLYKAIKS